MVRSIDIGSVMNISTYFIDQVPDNLWRSRFSRPPPVSPRNPPHRA